MIERFRTKKSGASRPARTLTQPYPRERADRYRVEPTEEGTPSMGIGASIFLVAIGAILAFAVTTEVSGVDISTVGWILMIVGIAGFLMSLLFWSSWGGFGGYRRETIVRRDPYDQPPPY
jgi:hypothetical protein